MMELAGGRPLLPTPVTSGNAALTISSLGTTTITALTILALDRLSAICDGEIFVESAILDDFSPYRGGLGHGYSGGQTVMEFYPRDEYGRNHTNWWVPTVQCMVSLLEAAGFGDCRGWKLTDRPTAVGYCRGFAYGRKVTASTQWTAADRSA